MSEPDRFPDSVFDRIGTYLPMEQRVSYFRYIAHLRTLNPKDELLVLAEGMALFACIARQVPEALGDEGSKLLAEFGRLCAKHEATTSNIGADLRALFTAQHKLMEQNIATWQNREQHTTQTLDRIAKHFEESASQCTSRLQMACGEIQKTATENQVAATKVQHWIARVSLENRFWPCLACGVSGALLGAVVTLLLLAPRMK